MFVIKTFKGKIEKGAGPIPVSSFRRLMSPNYSFPEIITPGCLEGFDWAVYEYAEIPLTTIFEKVIESGNIFQDGIFKQVLTISSISEKEKQDLIEKEWSKIRAKRNADLYNTDWIHMPDANINSEFKTLMIKYRQDLRDITDQTDPFNITWPLKPTK